MNCEKYSEWISLYIDGELEGDDKVTFENHISTCDSCHEELTVLQEITKDIRSLESIEVPEGFHDDLMRKIKNIPIQQRKWYLNLKLASAVAAVFIFSTILIKPLTINAPKDSAPEQANNMAKSRMMMDSPADFGIAPAAEMAPEQPIAEAAVEETEFSSDEIILEESVETWVITTNEQVKYEEVIADISFEMGIGISYLEDNKLEIILDDRQRAELEIKLKGVDQKANITIQNQDKEDLGQVDYTVVKLIIIFDNTN